MLLPLSWATLLWTHVNGCHATTSSRLRSKRPTRLAFGPSSAVSTTASPLGSVEELLTDRGVEVDHVTIYRWVLRFTPLLADAARPCRPTVRDCQQVDETYVKVAGEGGRGHAAVGATTSENRRYALLRR
jgi:hypothetical protein